MRRSLKRIGGLLAALALLPLSPAAVAQDAWPTRPVRWIVPYSAGGLPDTIARIVAQKVSEGLGQQVTVENRGGAGGIPGSQAVARAAPDGYTFLVADVGQVPINQFLYAKLPYDPVKDFVPVGLIATANLFLVANAGVPVKDFDELVALAKAKPGQLNYGSSGVGSIHHLATESLAASSKFSDAQSDIASTARQAWSGVGEIVYEGFEAAATKAAPPAESIGQRIIESVLSLVPRLDERLVPKALSAMLVLQPVMATAAPPPQPMNGIVQTVAAAVEPVSKSYIQPIAVEPALENGDASLSPARIERPKTAAPTPIAKPLQSGLAETVPSERLIAPARTAPATPMRGEEAGPGLRELLESLLSRLDGLSDRPVELSVTTNIDGRKVAEAVYKDLRERKIRNYETL